MDLAKTLLSRFHGRATSARMDSIDLNKIRIAKQHEKNKDKELERLGEAMKSEQQRKSRNSCADVVCDYETGEMASVPPAGAMDENFASAGAKSPQADTITLVHSGPGQSAQAAGPVEGAQASSLAWGSVARCGSASGPVGSPANAQSCDGAQRSSPVLRMQGPPADAPAPLPDSAPLASYVLPPDLSPFENEDYDAAEDDSLFSREVEDSLRLARVRMGSSVTSPKTGRKKSLDSIRAQGKRTGSRRGSSPIDFGSYTSKGLFDFVTRHLPGLHGGDARGHEQLPSPNEPTGGRKSQRSYSLGVPVATSTSEKNAGTQLTSRKSASKYLFSAESMPVQRAGIASP